MRICHDPCIALADLAAPAEVSTESDTSAHSYRLQDVVVQDVIEPSPFAATPIQSQRLSVTSGSSVPVPPRPHPSPGLNRPSDELSLPGRRVHSAIRVSMDLPADRTLESLDNAQVEGRIVRRRRRLPINIVLGFGIVSVLCLCVGLTTLSIGLYNFSKLKAARAAKTVTALSDDISPLIHALYNKLFQADTIAPP